MEKWFSPRLKNLHNQLCEMSSMKKSIRRSVFTGRFKIFKRKYKMKIIHEHRRRKRSHDIQLLDEKKFPTSNPKDVAALFNHHFASLARSQYIDPDSYKIPSCGE
ncbi:hypothetical protein HHI36_011845 [Cryptolaemus montrouzieri]|uniref:Uncharacterized protein n=1 Tax=Cryptolaemus montrouzieri TaxID=559131 RepID=A0ABD2ND28_9CUCU